MIRYLLVALATAVVCATVVATGLADSNGNRYNLRKGDIARWAALDLVCAQVKSSGDIGVVCARGSTTAGRSAGVIFLLRQIDVLNSRGKVTYIQRRNP
jgi:hypothetical protein